MLLAACGRGEAALKPNGGTMRLVLRIVLVVAVAPVVLIIGERCWFSVCGVGVDDLPACAWTLRQEQIRTKLLETKTKHLRPRLDEEARMLSRLVAGDVTIAEAAGRVRRLRSKEEYDFLLEKLRATGNGDSDDELICRQFIAAIEGMYSIKQGEAAQQGILKQHEMEKRQVLRRLEQELAAYLGGKQPAKSHVVNQGV